MTQRRSRAPGAATIALLAAIAAAAGCSSYYHVTEPTSGRTYLTNEFNEDLRRETGVVVFRDAVTGADVSLSDSEVVRIGKHEFRELVRYAEANPPASIPPAEQRAQGGAE